MFVRLAAGLVAAAAALTLSLGGVPAANADKPHCTGDRHQPCPPTPPTPPVVTPPTPVPSGFHLLIGTRFRDRLVGTLGRDAIFGLAGNDSIIGRRGADRLYGNRGNDVLRGGVDGARDVMNGGLGFDTCVGDAIDIMRSCERRIVV